MIWNLPKFFKRKSSSKTKDLEKSMTNIMQSFSHSQPLYKKLIRQCHPDNFINSEQRERAVEYSKRINQNRYDYSELKKIEEEINNLQ